MADHELRIGADCRKCGRRNIEHANGLCPQPQAYAYTGPLPDCRTCKHLSGTLRFECRDRGPTLCTNGDRYEPLPPVRLWRKE